MDLASRTRRQRWRFVAAVGVTILWIAFLLFLIVHGRRRTQASADASLFRRPGARIAVASDRAARDPQPPADGDGQHRPPSYQR